MTYSYEFLPGVALADTAFRVTADNWGHLFSGAAEALTSVMVNIKDLREERHVPVNLTAAGVDELLYDWLSEMVYLKDTEAFLSRSTRIEVLPGAIWQVKGEFLGDSIRPGEQKLGQDVKAVTYHLFEVSRKGSAYEAQVVLDI